MCNTKKTEEGTIVYLTEFICALEK